MQIRVSARQTVVPDRDRALINEKIERLGKFLPGMENAEVHFFAEKNPRIADKEVCEVTLQGHGHHVRAAANGPDHLTAVDRVVAKLENKLRKLKTRLARKAAFRDQSIAKRAQGATEIAIDDFLPEPDTEAAVEEAAEYRIVKMKQVEKLVLSPDDAALRMDLVSHDFYFFTNADTGRAAVVYRRDDGDVGLIDEID